MIGNCANGGVHTEHPSMNPALLTDYEEPAMVVDFRDVFGTVVADWSGDWLGAVFPG